jgi:hypothetical protein
MAASETVSREQLRAAIDDEMRQWDDLVNEVGLSHMNEPGFMGEWTFLDVAAHITAWRRQTIDRLTAAANGQPEPKAEYVDGTDAEVAEPNRRIYEKTHSQRAVDILHEAHDSYEQIKRAVDALSLEDLTNPTRFTWSEGKSINDAVLDRSLFGHFHDEHEADIRKRLAELNAQ